MSGHVTTRPLYTREITPIGLRTETKAASASVGVDILEKRKSLSSNGIRIPDGPALYRLRYPGSPNKWQAYE